MIKCVCLDASGKPNVIPQEKWVKLEEWYHITLITYHPNQKIQGCCLYEKPLGEECFPFETFRLSRFGVLPEDYQKFIEFMKECTKLNDVDCEKLLEEAGLVKMDN